MGQFEPMPAGRANGRIGQTDPPPGAAKAEPEKNPAAVALGRLGGKKGGPARAKALSAKKRSEIARRAAAKRWGKTDA